MRDLRALDGYRITDPKRLKWVNGWAGDKDCGAFEIPSPTGSQTLMIVASNGEGWDHVSVSLPNRCPNWPEMDKIKRLFFKDDEVAMQLHVASKDHVNCHPYCLHLWRPHEGAIPLPPSIFVGPDRFKGESSDSRGI